MNINSISYCTILTLLLLCKIQLFTCLDISSSQSNGHTQTSTVTSSTITNNSVNNSIVNGSFSLNGSSVITTPVTHNYTVSSIQESQSTPVVNPDASLSSTDVSQTTPSHPSETSESSLSNLNNVDSSINTSDLKLVEQSQYPSEIKLYTVDSTDATKTVEIDKSKYNVHLYGSLKPQYFYDFKEDSKCVKVECNDKEVWKYDSTKHEGKHPIVIRFIKDDNINIYFGTEEIKYKKTENGEWKQYTETSTAYTNITMKFSSDNDASWQTTEELTVQKYGSIIDPNTVTFQNASSEETQTTEGSTSVQESTLKSSQLTTTPTTDESGQKVMLLIIDVNIKQTTDHVEYNRDDKTGFDIFTAKDQYKIYSAKKGSVSLWKSSKTDYPIGIAFKEQDGKPLLRIFHKKDLTSSLKETSNEDNQDEDLTVIEMNKPSLTTSDSSDTSKKHKEVEEGYESENEAFTTDDYKTASLTNYSENGEFPKPNETNKTTVAENQQIDIVEVGERTTPKLRIGEKPKSEDVEELIKINEKLENITKSLETISKSFNLDATTNLKLSEGTISISTSGKETTTETKEKETDSSETTEISIVDDKTITSESEKSTTSDSNDLFSGTIDLQSIEYFCQTCDSDSTHHSPTLSEYKTSIQDTSGISDQQNIQALYGEGTTFVTLTLESTIPTTETASTSEDDLDFTVVDSHSTDTSIPEVCSPTDVTSEKTSHQVINVFQSQTTPTPTPTITPTPILTTTVQHTHTSPEQTTTQSTKYTFDHSSKLRGSQTDISTVISQASDTLLNNSKNLKIHTINDDEVTTSLNDETRYDISKTNEMYTYTFKSGAKCVKIEYENNVWTYKPSDPNSVFPTRILLSIDKFKIEFPNQN